MGENADDVSESAARAAYEVRVVFGRLRRRMQQTYTSGELTPSQSSALSRLDKVSDASVSDLAAAERVRHQSMAATVEVLAVRGLVSRRQDPEDGRRQLISVNKAGRKFVTDRRRAGEEWLSRVLDDRLDETERQTVLAAMALLERLTS